ncbi:hypothetical protein BJX64DRAFT_260968 [Aspergillus heterothallicus]
MPDPHISTSNWDFTAVINLLRSPISQVGSQLSSDNSPSPASSIPLPLSQKLPEHDSDGPIIQEQSAGNTNIRVRRLGDFDSIWGVLGSPGPSLTLNESVTRGLNRSEKIQQPIKPVVILKRSPTPDASVKAASTPRTRSKRKPDAKVTSASDMDSDIAPISGSRSSAHHRRHRYRDQPNNESVSLDSIAIGESDSPSIFDVPHSKPQNIISSMIPPQLGFAAANAGSHETPPSSYDESDGFMSDAAKQLLSTTRLEPLVYRTIADQRVGLLTKLLNNFPDYAELLIRSSHLKKAKVADISSRPIHVFVDMSNIMVGFHDTMKISRDIPISTRIRRIPLAFQNFSLILERGRATAKRVLVGSDRYAAINESEKLGYEANILDRVQKVKSLPPRQLKFRKHPRAALHDRGHGSEMNDAAEQRWVEQGVDEILHLKILESLVDVDEPATIVLATGDAAEAEFSGGFLKMVERALQRGWKVELVSFSQVTSYSYRKKEFRSRWGDQFQMVALDEYIEELLVM